MEVNWMHLGNLGALGEAFSRGSLLRGVTLINYSNP